MDYLFLLTPDFDLIVVNWAEWIDLLFGNSSDRDVHYRALVNNHNSKNRFSGELTLADDEHHLGPPPDEVIVDRQNLGITSCSDWLIYNRVLYYATSQDVWMRPLLINGYFEGIDEARRIVDVPTHQLRAKYGVITAACGLWGLATRPAYTWAFQDVPRIESQDYEDVEADRGGWMERDFLAIGHGAASMFLNTYVRADYGSIGGETVQRESIVQFGWQRKDQDQLFERPPEFESGFATNRVLYAWSGSRVETFNLSSGRQGKFELPTSKIYDGFSWVNGVVFDTSEGTYSSGPGGRKPVLVSTEPNVIVRSFNQARYYSNQIWSVKENRIEITVPEQLDQLPW